MSREWMDQDEPRLAIFQFWKNRETKKITEAPACPVFVIFV
jgi:hypothetical protein